MCFKTVRRTVVVKPQSPVSPGGETTTAVFANERESFSLKAGSHADAFRPSCWPAGLLAVRICWLSEYSYKTEAARVDWVR